MKCRLCGGSSLLPVHSGNAVGSLESRNFRVSDAHYGTILPLYDCAECGFRQTAPVGGLLTHYQDLQDADYEAGRETRKKQMEDLLGWLWRKAPSARAPDLKLLDVGAGSGILVEVAQAHGYDSLGVEPSRWFCDIARSRNLPVVCATVDQVSHENLYDVITLVDVIEHVNDPVELLKSCSSLLGDNGVMLVITPDCSSAAARLLGWKWWHYRIAHVSYFTPQTLSMALNAAGLELLESGRPGWHFTVRYLCERIKNYLPEALIPDWQWLDRISIPLNLRDSMAIVAGKKIYGTAAKPAAATTTE